MDTPAGQESSDPKNVGLAAAMTDALVARGASEPVAHLAAELGVLAFKRGFAEWSEGTMTPPSRWRRTPSRPSTSCAPASAALG